jgi:Zinc carboxypeptidase
MSSKRGLRASRHSLGVGSLFPLAAVFQDTDGDGYPDRLGLCLAVDSRLADAGMWAALINLAARLAGEVVALDCAIALPLAKAPGDRLCLVITAPDSAVAAPAVFRRHGPHRVTLTGSSAAVMAAVLDSLAVCPFMANAIPDTWQAIQAGNDPTEVLDVVDRRERVIARIRLASGFALPPGERPPLQPADLLGLDAGLSRAPAEDPRRRRLLLTLDLDRRRVSAPLGFALAGFVARAALAATEVQLPLAFAGRAVHRGVVLQVRENGAERPGLRWAGRTIRAAGRAAALAACIRDWTRVGFPPGGPGCGTYERWHARVDAVRQMLTGGGRPLGTAPAAASGLRLRESWSSEVRRVADALRRLPTGTGALDGFVMVSKPVAARRALAADLSKILREKGYRPRLTVLNAYKPALSWLLEVVQPQLRKTPGLTRIELAFRPFSAGPRTLEMKSRWAQEIFPGPDLLAAGLGWPAASIRLVRRAGLSEAYRIRAWDAQNRLAFERGFTPRWTRLAYLPGRPQLGNVHPTCGGVRLLQGRQVLLDADIATDREVFWRRFQERWLPAIEARMRAFLKASRGRLPLAFWEEVRIDVALDESDQRLGLGEERVAPMEALHEDLYFVLLDFFRVFAEEHKLPPEVQFGRIFPVVAAAAPAGRPSGRLKARPFSNAAHVSAGRAFSRPRVAGLVSEGAALTLRMVFPKQAPAAEEAERIRAAGRARGHDLRFDPAGRSVFLRLAAPRPSRQKEAGPADVAAPPLDRLLKAAEVAGWVRRLGRLPDVCGWRAGSSWQGRPVWALEAALGAAGKTISLPRLRLLKPSLLVNARHHANEISSTNAALALVWELGATEWGRAALKRVNVAVVPLENADGVATLEALQPGAPDHKLHAARYNALGVEWYGDYFSDAPRFPEARVKPRLWRRWLPRIVLDAHGVPSHEWDQPFSGYAPGRFRAYWIPRAFIYAVIPFLDRPDHPGYAGAHELARVMARGLAGDAEMAALDRELGSRYRRYARNLAPETFPPAASQTLMVLPPEERIGGLNFAVRQFPVTVSEIITEVTDEVVSGRLLALCARGHLTVAKALIDFLGRRPPGRLDRVHPKDGGLVLEWRPGD